MKNCCIWLVIYLNCMMMHGLTNLKVYVVNNFFKTKESSTNLHTAMIWRQAINTCFQCGNKILADTHLKISVRTE